MALAAGQTGHLTDHQEGVYQVDHGATAGTARPTLGSSSTSPNVVLWNGSVEPTNAQNGDWWFDSANSLVKVKEGGSFVASGNGTYTQWSGGSKVAYFGDSITNYSEPFPYYAGILSKQRLRTHQVVSYPGQASTALLGNITDITEASDPAAICVILCGSNDAQGAVSVSTFASNIEAMVDALRAAAMLPVLCTVPPLDNDTDNGYALTYNAWITRYANANRIPLVDVFTLCIDQSTGNWKSAYSSGDGIHPNAAGCAAIGQEVADTLSGLVPPADYLVQPIAGGSNLIANSNFLTDTNADGLADGISATPASGFAYSLEADAAGFNWQRVTLTSTGAERTLLCSEDKVSTGDFAVGDDLMIAVRVRNGQSGTSAKMVLQYTFYNDAYAVMLNRILTTPVGMTREVSDGVVYSVATVPSGATRGQLSFKVGSADGTYDFGQPTVLNLTDLGITI